MCVYIQINMYLYKYVYLCVYIYIYIYVCVCIYVYIYIYMCIYIYIYVCVFMGIYIYMDSCVYISSSCHAASTDIPNPLSLLLPIIHHLRQVFRVHSVSSHSCCM